MREAMSAIPALCKGSRSSVYVVPRIVACRVQKPDTGENELAPVKGECKPLVEPFKTPVTVLEAPRPAVTWPLVFAAETDWFEDAARFVRTPSRFDTPARSERSAAK